MSWESKYDVLISVSPQGTDDWRKTRIGRITGSNITAFIGKHKFNPQDIAILEVCGQHVKEQNEHMTRGVEKEPIARELYRKTLPQNFSIVELGFIIPKWNNYIGVSLDGLILDDKGIPIGICEIKCPTKLYQYQSIPDAYMDQMQWAMGIMKAAWCDFVVFIDDNITIERVYRKEDYFEYALLLTAMTVHKQHVLPKIISGEIAMVSPIMDP